MATQFICESKPHCKCAWRPNAWDECCCVAKEPGAHTSMCSGCGASLIRIDMDTGKPTTIPKGTHLP